MPPPSRSKTPITDLDAPDGVVQNAENQQMYNNNNSSTSNHNNTHGNPNHNSISSNNTKLERKTSIPTAQNKHLNEDEKHSMAGDPIYQTISSEKGAKSLGRNCISLENLRTLTIKNDLNSYGNNLLQNHNGQSSAFYILPTFPPPPNGYHPSPHHYFSHKPQFVYGPPPFAMQPQLLPPPPPPHQQPHLPYFHQNYQRPFTNYGGYTNPNPYSNLSNTNSRQSVGNESDDYRKYRDVAL